jgi:hypothetical protein
MRASLQRPLPGNGVPHEKTLRRTVDAEKFKRRVKGEELAGLVIERPRQRDACRSLCRDIAHHGSARERLHCLCHLSPVRALVSRHSIRVRAHRELKRVATPEHSGGS